MCHKLLKNKEKILSVAPMMDWTDRHCRFFHRLLAPDARLYTEMLTAQAIIHGDRDYLLGFDPAEHPIALQLGGSDPALMVEAARIGEAAGYDEININVGCPSDRVREGRFGACLFAEPDVVAACVEAMGAAVDVPVTVKTRIAIDEMEGDEPLDRFADAVAQAGCRELIVHARKAWLTGLSPKENRSVPPLDYERVYRLKARRPDLRIVINGGIESVEAAAAHLRHVDGVMFGRAAYQNPYLLAGLQADLIAEPDWIAPERSAIVASMADYAASQMAAQTPAQTGEQGRSPARPVRLHSIARHLHGLFQGMPGARAWRRALAENAHKPGAGPSVLEDALAEVDRQQAIFRSKAA